MSPLARELTTMEDGEEEMIIGQELRPSSSIPSASSTAGENHGNQAVLLRDVTNWISHVRGIRQSDVVVLLTPIVIPTSQEPTSDPRIRQVPYNQRNGITSTHLGFIKRGHVVILCFATQPNQQIQLEVANVAFAVSDNKPCIIVVCCGSLDVEQDLPFPTIIKTAGYSPSALEATASLIFGDQSQSAIRELPEPVHVGPPRPRLWPVEQWNEKQDMSGVMSLWVECVDTQFSIDQQTLESLLCRPGYAKHYVVWDSRNVELLGFCATFLAYFDREGEKLIASLAILLVRSTSRRQGIGLSLHNHAVDQLRRTRGVVCLQLGSTYPRIFYGPPFNMHINEEWFHRRGWQLNGVAVYDLVLDLCHWQVLANVPHPGAPHFRQCTQEDMANVLGLVQSASLGHGKFGWFEQYSSLMSGPNVKDVILGVQNETIFAAALTYTPSCGSKISLNLPWAGRIGNDVGGISCICVRPDREGMTVAGLIDACVKILRGQGMKKMFLDGVTHELESYAQLGFQEWAGYRDVWKDV